MLKHFTILLLIISFQLSAQEDTTFTRKDFNGDGYIDTLKTGYDGGSAFGGRYAIMINGKTNHIYENNTYGPFSNIIKLILLPEELAEKENEDFDKAIREKIFPVFKKEPDASLEWIISAFQNFTHIKDHKYFDLIIDPKIKWKDKAIELPGIYYTDIHKDESAAIYQPAEGNPMNLDKNTGKAYIIYYGHNHYRFKDNIKDSLLRVAENEHYTIYRTSHGILAKKGKKHKWLFITTEGITGAPGKLRWESVDKVYLKNDMLIIIQKFPIFETYNHYIIDIETGLCGRLKAVKGFKSISDPEQKYLNLLIKELETLKN